MSISILHLNFQLFHGLFFIFFIFFHKPGTRPSGKKYVSACNYLNTMGSSGNAPSRGCAPHCWMGFRMLELAQMRDVLPTPPALHLNNITKIPVRVSNNDDVLVAAVVEDGTKETWTADPFCIKMNDPFNQVRSRAVRIILLFEYIWI